jgi:DNA (cytosine-5)-methyltransferase 1
MKYLSCFSGIGGLEASHSPLLFCEQEATAAHVLRTKHPDVEIWPDICTLHPPQVDMVAGGWPCQDLSIAGKQEGLAGLRSQLLRELLRVAVEARAHIVVAENVTNLLKMRDGIEFAATLAEFNKNGFHHVAWRILNAREFGLPQNRSRLIIIASKELNSVYSLFRDVASTRPIIDRAGTDVAAGFYWTAGTHSINYTRGYVPTIKIGSSLGIASPPAIHYGDIVRTLSPDESLRLQGFDLVVADFPNRTAAYKAAGNAVARDIGRWVLDGVSLENKFEHIKLRMTQGLLFPQDLVKERFPTAGLYSKGIVTPVDVTPGLRASNLSDFLDLECSERLSARAATGLLKRLNKSQIACPNNLRVALTALSREGVI